MIRPGDRSYVVYNEGRQLYWPKEDTTMLPHTLGEAREWAYANDAKEKADSINARGPENQWRAYRVTLEAL